MGEVNRVGGVLADPVAHRWSQVDISLDEIIGSPGRTGKSRGVGNEGV